MSRVDLSIFEFVEFRRSYRNFWRVKITHKRFFLRVKTGYFRIFMRQNPGLRVKRKPWTSFASLEIRACLGKGKVDLFTVQGSFDLLWKQILNSSCCVRIMGNNSQMFLSRIWEILPKCF